MNATEVRAVEEREIDYLATLWYDGWQNAHAQIVPAELPRLRSLESFRHRLEAALADTRVIGPLGAPYGFCITKGDELYQIYVSAQTRGSGAAAELIADAETRLANNGVEVAWLACAIGNERAARCMKNLIGAAFATSLTRRKHQPEPSRSRCGVTRKS
jgi:GNAT superfamily N-acetyltransferase